MALPLRTINHSKMFRLLAIVLLAVGMTMVVGIPSHASDRYTDVHDGHPFHDEISWITEHGIAAGWDDGTFRPSRDVTRQAMVAFLYRSAGAPEGPFPDPGFSDVGSNHPFYAEISWAAGAGVTEGYGDGTFRSTNPVSRMATAAFMYRLAGEPAAPGGSTWESSFPDVSSEHPFYTEISWLAAMGITTGYDDGEFKPSRGTTRQAMAAFLMRFLELANPHVVVDGPSQTVGLGTPIEGFSARVWNDGPVRLVEDAGVAVAISRDGGISGGDLEVEYHDGSDWNPLDLAEDDDALKGWFGPIDGFAIPAGYDVTTQLRVTFNTAGDYSATATLTGVTSGEAYDDDTLTVTALPDPAVVNVDTSMVFGDIQSAVDAAGPGETLHAYGAFDDGATVSQEVILVGMDDASVAGSLHVTADNVTIQDLSIAGYDTVLGEIVGIYLQAVDNVTITGNSLDGGEVAGSRAVLTSGTVTGVVSDNDMVDNTTGVSNNPGSQLTISGNTFTNNTAGVGSDSDDGVVVTGNTFIGNDEGVGLGGVNVTVEGNDFQASNTAYICDYIAGYDLSSDFEDNTYETGPYIDGNCLVSGWTEPAVVNVDTSMVFGDIQSAVDAAGPGETLHAYGAFDDGATVSQEVILVGMDDASVAGSLHVTADNVTIQDLSIAGYDTVLGEIVGIYLQAVDNVTITGNSLDGGEVAGSRAVLTSGTVTGVVSDNDMVDNTTGVSNNPGSQLTISGNTFTNNTAGVGSDSDDGVVVTGNTFIGNDEGVGLGGVNVTVEGNDFQASNTAYICDYIAGYDLSSDFEDNTYETGPYIDGNCLVSGWTEPAVVNVDTSMVFGDIQSAVDAAGPGETLHAYGAFDDGATVSQEVILVGMDDASVAGSLHVTADNVTIQDLSIAGYDTVLGEIVGIYLQAVDNVTITGNSLDGGEVAGSRAVLTSGTVTGVVSDNDMVDNTTGVSNNPGSQLTISGNTFTNNTAGVGSDSDDGVVVTGNTFIGNDEGVGLGGVNVTVEGNDFQASNTAYICDYIAGYDLSSDFEDNTYETGPYIDDNCLVSGWTEPAVVNVDTSMVFGDIQSAVDAAGPGETLHAYGAFDDGATVSQEVILVGMDDASVAGSLHVTADNVTIQDLSIAGYDTVLGEIVGIYLQAVDNVTITGNSLDGGEVAGSRAVLTSGTVTGVVSDNDMVDNTTGVSNNPGSQLTISGNTFTNNTAGVGSDSDDGVVVTGNTFIGNDEGVGLGGVNVTVEGNDFQASNTAYICDYIAGYDLSSDFEDNTYETGPYIDGNCLVSGWTEPAVVNVDTSMVFGDIQSAVDAAGPGETLHAYGAFDDGATVSQEVILVGMDDASVAGSLHVTADNVTIQDLSIAGYDTVLGEIVGIYLQAVDNVTITGNSLDGGEVAGSRAVLTSGTVTGVVSDNDMVDNTTGVSNNPGSQLTISGNTFTNNTAGVGSDSDDGVVVTGNTFIGNDEGVGLGGVNVTVEGNDFQASNTAYICDYIAGYDLSSDFEDNTYETGPYIDDNCLVSEEP
jgi:hypothetical protein